MLSARPFVLFATLAACFVSSASASAQTTSELSELPEGLLGDEVDPWASHWRTLTNGPAGCWEVTGRATWSWTAGRFGETSGNAAFVGRLNNGRWGDMVIKSMGETVREGRAFEKRIYAHDEQRFVPLVGTPPPSSYRDSDNDNEPSSMNSTLLDDLLADLSGETSYETSEADLAKNAVILTANLPIGSSGDTADLVTTFPNGGIHPTRLSVRFPPAFKLPDAKIVTIRNAKADVVGKRAGGLVFPSSEALSFDARVLGFNLHGAQSITYTAFRPCPMGPEEVGYEVQINR